MDGRHPPRPRARPKRRLEPRFAAGSARAPPLPPRPAPDSARAPCARDGRRDVRRGPSPRAPAHRPDAARELAPRPPVHAVVGRASGTTAYGAGFVFLSTLLPITP